MNIVRLLTSYSIPHNVIESRGWVETKCVFCPDQSMNLGIHLESGAVSCWKCGRHRLDQAIARMLKVSIVRANGLIEEFGGKGSPESRRKEANAAVRLGARRPFKFPTGCGDVHPNHMKYLSKRGFDAKRIIHEWRIMGCGPISKLDEIDYKWRIVIPVMWNDRVVSFQARDVTNAEGRLRYLACPKDREIVPYKSIVYGKQEEWKRYPNEWYVCVEGVTDVWRLGRQAFATFGTAVTKEQVRCIAKEFTKVIVAFDIEAQAQIEARKLVGELRFRGVRAELARPLSKDPGSMSDQEAERFLQEAIAQFEPHFRKRAAL